MADQSQFYHYDGAGNVLALTDATGVITQRLAYEAFGSRLGPPTPSAAPYTFSTKRAEPRTGFLDFGARWYDPAIGRFLSPDPAGFTDGPNLYAFVGNDPVNLIDPVGLMGVPLQLTDVRRLADLGNAMEAQRGGVRFRVFTRANGRSYVANTGRLGTFPLAPAARRLDTPVVARYLNPATAARGAAWGWGGGLTAILVTTQDVLDQLAREGSLTDPAFLWSTALDVGEGLAAGAVGAGFGAVATAWSGNPALGITVGTGASKGVGAGLDFLERLIVDLLTTERR